MLCVILRVLGIDSANHGNCNDTRRRPVQDPVQGQAGKSHHDTSELIYPPVSLRLGCSSSLHGQARR